jgi:biotin-(acetyl-CoA carboxylase) ligase
MLWKSRGYKFNQHITISDGDSTVSGMFFDIDDNGRVIIQNDDGLHIVERGSLR